ncbi:CopG family transcriptional regulator [Sandaracinobacteroides hominis]|uniref:CopG family transcriptional regulator n=1 Tax=Sandaracinobacteroides hominis TaxID=2780086 RepID=UPI0018F61112|nr:CopG family transcriptional regulator [Sandaracinobacteroides hominis]
MRPKQPRKRRLSVYLEPNLLVALEERAARRDHSLSMIAEAAVAAFLSPDDGERREAAIAKRLDQIDRRIARIERDQTIAVETMAMFVRFWLTTTPALPEPQAAAARAKGFQRYDAFLAALSRRMASSSRLARELAEDIASTGPTTDMER